MSLFLSTEDCDRAVDFVRPIISWCQVNGTFSRQCLAIVIGDPRLVACNMTLPEWKERGILYTRMIVQSGAEEERDFTAIAESKCYISWRYGISSRRIQAEMPYFLDLHDTSYYGSVNYDGLAVACSGVQQYYDEMLALQIAAACRAIAMVKRETQALTLDGNGFFR